MDVQNCQPYWRKQIANIFQGLHFNHHGNKVKIFNDLQNNLLVTHGSTWVLNILTSCLWFRRVKTSWKTVVDLSRGNHTKCPKFQNLQYYCKFYPGYLVTRTGDRKFVPLVSGWLMDKPGTKVNILHKTIPLPENTFFVRGKLQQLKWHTPHYPGFQRIFFSYRHWWFAAKPR